ncbi:DUF3575 domain-containing protein [Bacteroides reticulotermitis]|uniref:DUF3575 domain-containing protein n=1 Tax=Bacteroides reticulotermitis TaxID=1133319 RepID=UPI003A85976A
MHFGFFKIQVWSARKLIYGLVFFVLVFYPITQASADKSDYFCQYESDYYLCDEKNKCLPDDDNISSSEPIVLHFRVSSSYLDANYMSNTRSLNILRRALSNKDFVANIKKITISATASPEGSIAGNKVLAEDRALSLKSHLLQNYPFLHADEIQTFPTGENWSGLREMVEADINVPHRDEVLHIIDGPLDTEQKKIALSRLPDNAYGYIIQNIYPDLRGVVACMIYYNKTNTNPIVIYDTIRVADKPQIIEVVRVDTVYIEKQAMVMEKLEPKDEDRNRKIRYIALKTNIAYDALFLPNVALEFALGNRWTLEVEGMWSWWNTDDSRRYYHRIQSGGIEVRKWLGSKSKTPFTGHYFGLYGMGGTYDIKYNTDTGYLSDCSYSAGLSYGYAFPIAKRLNLEFGIGVGYLGGEYKKYTFDPEYNRYPWQSTHSRTYFGPTKAKISLVWLIGSGVNVNKLKGRR